MSRTPTTPAPAPPADILYGVAGWSYDDWQDVVYPKSASPEDKLVAVASLCDLLEVNTTFYRTPGPAMTAAWAGRLTRAGLPTRLVVKIGRQFTHDEAYSADDVRALKEALAPLDDGVAIDRNGIEQPRLLGLLLQFPVYFRLTPENTQRIERLAEDFADWTKVIELRHPSWARTASYGWLRKLGLNLANIDLPAGGAAGPTGAQSYAFPREVTATGPVGYVRLHGRNNAAWFDRNANVAQKYNYRYSPAELGDLASRVRELAGRTKTVAVIGNNHFRGKAVATVLELALRVNGRRASVPPTLLTEYPELATFAEAIEPPPDSSSKPPRKPRAPAPPRDDDPNQFKLF